MPWTKLAIDRSIQEDTSFILEEVSRKLSYREAIKEALAAALEIDGRVFIMGEGVDDPAGIFGTTTGLHKRFGKERVFDIPIAENAMTGVAIGAALAGMRPIFIHMRMDFLLLAMDQIVNHAAKIKFMTGGRVTVPLVIRSIIGRGWGSAAQHTQSLHAYFFHTPGLKVVIPATPYDVKGLFLSSIADGGPVIFIEHRWLYDLKGHVPQKEYLIPIGKGIIRKEGRDVTVVAISHMVLEAIRASDLLKKEGIDIEIIDPRSLKPLDEDLILASVKKTGRLVIADLGWKTCGAGAEIAALAAEKAFECLSAPVKRIALPDVPTPASFTLEKTFYPGPEEIVHAVKEVLGRV